MKTELPRYRVWDLPSRLSHWLLAVLILIQFASGLFELLPMSAHVWGGYMLLVVVLFRILWGFWGSQSARFSTFLRGPAAVVCYSRTIASEKPSHWPGHNPLGGWSIVLLLGLTLVQSITGLFAQKIGEVAGPLATRVDRDTAQTLHDLHEWLHWILLMFIVIHVIAALFYLLHKRENLIGPIFGKGRLSLSSDPQLRFAGSGRALLLLSISVALVAAVVVLGNGYV